ncbi:MAG: dCTP deaminase [Candidatus Thermoplasmatota archaeon]|nr:dCTP deaminase [Candidatus Thermoplasmatota archaeon]MDP7264584.1 dCTP deaminase [Candidatus Thermoplasmatota archaeon]
MTVLSDVDIIKEIEKKNLKIDPFSQNNLTPNGYDLSIREIMIPELVKTVDSGEVVIPARMWFAAATRERLKFGPRLVGNCWIRTTFARQGLIPSFGMIDAGFEGTLTFNFFNSSKTDRVLEIGVRIAQLVVQRLSSTPTSLYDERSGNYQGQEGVTLSKNSRGF